MKCSINFYLKRYGLNNIFNSFKLLNILIQSVLKSYSQLFFSELTKLIKKEINFEKI